LNKVLNVLVGKDEDSLSDLSDLTDMEEASNPGVASGSQDVKNLQATSAKDSGTYSVFQAPCGLS
jgi:hypothetical protein